MPPSPQSSRAELEDEGLKEATLVIVLPGVGILIALLPGNDR